jgi:hypothetical protein
LRSICHANIDMAKIAAQWEQIVHLVASVHEHLLPTLAATKSRAVGA